MPVMGVDSLKANLTNPARRYLWEILINSDTNTWLLRGQSTSIPGRSVGDINIPFKQTGGIRVPGKVEFSHDWKVTLLEGEDGDTLDAVYSWLQAIVNARTGRGIGDVFIKSPIRLSLLTTTGSEWAAIYLVGAYPKQISEENLTVDGAGKNLTFDVTFSYDYWELVDENGLSIDVNINLNL